jgi:hypothetical protein
MLDRRSPIRFFRAQKSYVAGCLQNEYGVYSIYGYDSY